jgi:glyceraldehyde 3-phosphate dehydrogenase
MARAPAWRRDALNLVGGYEALTRQLPRLPVADRVSDDAPIRYARLDQRKRRIPSVRRFHDHQVAINGYSRIGRIACHYEAGRDLEIAINDLGSRRLTHLTRLRPVRQISKHVELDGDDDRRRRLHQGAFTNATGAASVGALASTSSWSAGRFTSKASASGHLRGGAKKVVISALAGGDIDATVVYGINHLELKPWHTVISMHRAQRTATAAGSAVASQIGIVSGIVTSIHGYTSDQALRTVAGSTRRGRSATMSIIPARSGAAAALGLILPELSGRLEGYGIRVPTINVAMVDLAFVAARDTTVEEINKVMKEAAATGPLAGILRYSAAPLVSIDFNHDPASATFDATLTKIAGRQVKVSAWYDNEWGYANRMLDTTAALMSARLAAMPRYATKATMIDPHTVNRMLETAHGTV